MIYYFICFPLLNLFHMIRKLPGLKNTHFNNKLFPIRRNFSPIWRNTLGHILLYTIANSPLCSAMLKNNISSNHFSDLTYVHLMKRKIQEDNLSGKSPFGRWDATFEAKIKDITQTMGYFMNNR